MVFVFLYSLVLASNMTWPYDVLIIWHFYGKFLDRESSYQYIFIFMDKSEGIWRGNNIWPVIVLSAKIKDKEWCSISQKLFQKEHGMTFGNLALLKDMVDHLLVHRPIMCSLFSGIYVILLSWLGKLGMARYDIVGIAELSTLMWYLWM